MMPLPQVSKAILQKIVERYSTPRATWGHIPPIAMPVGSLKGAYNYAFWLLIQEQLICNDGKFWIPTPLADKAVEEGLLD